MASDPREPPEDRVPEIEKLFEALPVTVNVGFPPYTPDTTIIGWSHAYRSKDDGRTTIVMSLDPEASELLKDLTEMFKLYAIGFAGIKKGSQHGG